MPGLTLHSSNRLEILIDRLAELIATPLADPFASEIILVQSSGMERWVSMELANRHGICANCRFPFPNSYIGELFGMLLPPVVKDSPYAPDKLGWKIMENLPGFLDEPSFAEIKSYLTNGPSGPGDFKLYQLSRRIADVFDQYLLFRPEMIMKWEKEGRGRDGGWQAQLWRLLSRDLQAPHRAALLRDFLRKAEKIESSPAFPERISIFGISALPPFHLDALDAASRITDVHMFVMNPCEEYWGEILSSRQMSRRSRSFKGKDPGKDLHMEAGNILLASMGSLGRDFLQMLLQKFDCEDDYIFVPPGRDSLLHSIQSDILELRDGLPQKASSFSDDRSIEVHSCHSPLREAEVLQDNLLALLEERPDIRPRDILVMMPDIATYAPFIEAVFSLPESDPRMIPFGIADKGLRAESRTINAFLGLLDMPASRFGAGRVLEVLESAQIREKFELNEPDVDIIREWVRGARICWGLDEGHRESLGLPGFTQNTWRAGLDRMLLGYALPEKDGEIFGGALPFDRIEGSASDLLGRFLAFTDKLFAAANAMGTERTLADWAGFLGALADDFFPQGVDISPDMDLLRKAFSELRGSGEIFRRKVGLDIVIDYLKRRLEIEGFGGRFLSGGITFCAMLPMRSIPFKIICLLGMDDGAYPRESSPPGFDLIAKEPRPGDRSRRLDDRYLFLETVLSAREKLYISYTGQDIRDNSERPPSVLVSELTDYLAGGYGITRTAVKHALQAFNQQYFQKRGLVSYSRENFAAARSLKAGGQRHAPAFFGEGLSEPEPRYRNITVDDLCNFFSNPARFLLTRRLGLILDDGADVLNDREPFEVRGLDRHELETGLLEKALQGTDMRREMERLRAGGLIPPGTPGECWFEETCASIARLAARVKALRAGTALEPFGVDLSLSGFRITGSISGLYPGGLVLHRPAGRERHLVTFWITRLVLDCAAAAVKMPAPAIAALCTGNIDCVYRHPENSPAILSGLLEIYRRGLTRPVPFFPQASWAYAEAEHDGRDDAEDRARAEFEGNDWSRGEIADLYVRRCFAGSDPLENPEFRELARGVIGPALECGDYEEHKRK